MLDGVRALALLILVAVGPNGPAEARADRRTGASFTVCLQPLGKHDARLLAPIARGIEQAYGFTVRELAPAELPRSAWYAPRKRYRADRLLDHLDAVVVPGSGCDAVVGVTGVDISVAKASERGEVDWGIFGLAYLDHRVAVVSSYRLRRKASFGKRVRRAVKVANHELGHVLGLPHRDGQPDAACIMNDAGGTVATVDRERGTLCADERAHVEAKLGVRLPTRSGLDWRAILGQ
jgi:archaemetzincin